MFKQNLTLDRPWAFASTQVFCYHIQNELSLDMMWNPIIHSTGTIDPKVVITSLDCFGALGVIIVVLGGRKHTIKWETNLISIPWSRRRYCLIIFGLVMLRREYSKSAVFSLSSVTGTAKVESEWHVPSY